MNELYVTLATAEGTLYELAVPHVSKAVKSKRNKQAG